jgi:hypothetical protein
VQLNCHQLNRGHQQNRRQLQSCHQLNRGHQQNRRQPQTCHQHMAVTNCLLPMLLVPPMVLLSPNCLQQMAVNKMN